MYIPMNTRDQLAVNALTEQVSIDERLPHIRLARVREMLGLTQVEFARQVGVSRSHICNLERGHTQLGLQAAVKIGWAIRTHEYTWPTNTSGDVPEWLKGPVKNTNT